MWNSTISIINGTGKKKDQKKEENIFESVTVVRTKNWEKIHFFWQFQDISNHNRSIEIFELHYRKNLEFVEWTLNSFAIFHSVSYIITTDLVAGLFFDLKDFVPASLLCDKFEFDDVITGEVHDGWLAAVVAAMLFFECIDNECVAKLDNVSSTFELWSKSFNCEWLVSMMSGVVLSFKRIVDADVSMTVTIELAVDSSTSVSSMG